MKLSQIKKKIFLEQVAFNKARHHTLHRKPWSEVLLEKLTVSNRLH
jgi:hypothetical protein